MEPTHDRVNQILDGHVYWQTGDAEDTLIEFLDAMMDWAKTKKLDFEDVILKVKRDRELRSDG